MLFSVYLDDLICELRQANVGCHMNGYFVGAVIYADDITLLDPTRSSILSMLSVCDVYARNMDILFNPAKTNCIFSPTYPNSHPGLQLHFMNTGIVFVPSCTFIGISVSSHDISNRNIPQSVQNLYRRSNKVMSHSKSLSRTVKSQLFSTFCLDAYGSQLWPFLITLLNCIILHGERLLGKLGACLSLLIVVFFIRLISIYLLMFN